jgi:hypothetical protein
MTGEGNKARRAPYQAIHEAYRAGWRVVPLPDMPDEEMFVVTHPSDPGEGRPDRPRIFDSIYLDTRSGWRAVLRYLKRAALSKAESR